MGEVALIVFGILLVATLSIHVIGYYLRPRSRWSLALLFLGILVVACMAWQFHSVRQDALKARLETARINEALAPREFSKAQHDRLVSFVRGLPNPPTSKVVFDSVVGNQEAKRYGGLVAKALSDAMGVPIDEPRGLSTCLECTGVWVCVNESATPETSDDGKTIRRAFEVAGISGAKFCADPKNGQGTPTTIKVIVGPKEQPSSGIGGQTP